MMSVLPIAVPQEAIEPFLDSELVDRTIVGCVAYRNAISKRLREPTKRGA